MDRILVRCNASAASGAADSPGWSDRSSSSDNGLHDQSRNGNGNGSSDGVENGVPGSKPMKDSVSPSQQSPVAKPSAGAASWPEMILSLPLELAAASAKMDAHWLRKRKRKHWWKREQFPRVQSPHIPPSAKGLFTCGVQALGRSILFI